MEFCGLGIYGHDMVCFLFGGADLSKSKNNTSGFDCLKTPPVLHPEEKKHYELQQNANARRGGILQVCYGGNEEQYFRGNCRPNREEC